MRLQTLLITFYDSVSKHTKKPILNDILVFQILGVHNSSCFYYFFSYLYLLAIKELLCIYIYTAAFQIFSK